MIHNLYWLAVWEVNYKHILQLQKDIDSLTVEMKYLKRKKGRVDGLKDMIWTSYTSEFCKQQ